MVAPNGARRTKVDHAALPMDVAETVQTAVACHAVGATALHLHVRDDMGQHSLDAGRYIETLAELSTALPHMPVQITTEAAGLFDVPAQLACLTVVKAKWASISVREIARSPDLADAVYGTCAENGTKVQHILYGTDDIALLADWQSQSIVRPSQTDSIFVLGRYTKGQMSAPEDLQPFLDANRSDGDWMVCAFGQNEHQCLAHAAALGGDLRVGFENNITDTDGTPFADNAASVAGLCRLLEASK